MTKFTYIMGDKLYLNSTKTVINNKKNCIFLCNNIVEMVKIFNLFIK